MSPSLPLVTSFKAGVVLFNYNKKHYNRGTCQLPTTKHGHCLLKVNPTSLCQRPVLYTVEQKKCQQEVYSSELAIFACLQYNGLDLFNTEDLLHTHIPFKESASIFGGGFNNKNKKLILYYIKNQKCVLLKFVIFILCCTKKLEER